MHKHTDPDNQVDERVKCIAYDLQSLTLAS